MNFKFSYFFTFSILMILMLNAGCSSVKKDTTDDFYFPYEEVWEKVDQSELQKNWNIGRLQEAHNYAKQLNMAGAIVLYKGKILQEWGDTYKKIPIHSVRKSLLSVLYGNQVSNRIIDLNSTLNELGIDDVHGLSDEEKEATVEMLLQARSGVYHPAAYETKGMAAKRPDRYSHDPGSFWYYNNWDFNALGEIYRQKTGKDIYKAFNDEIASPLNMDFNPAKDGKYVYDRSKSDFPAYTFNLSARNLARFGLLILNHGQWNGQEIVSEKWLEKVLTPYSETDSGAGYGYMWWVSLNGKQQYKDIPEGLEVFIAKGYKGHFLAVIPEKEIVFVFRNEDDNGKTTPYKNIAKLIKMLLDARQ